MYISKRTRSVIKILLLSVLLYVFISGAVLFYFRNRSTRSEEITPGIRGEGDYIALVESPREGARLRLALIDSAKESIDISYHTYKKGEYSAMFISSLLEAAERGVKIRFANDGIIGGLSGHAKDDARVLASHPNITLGFWEPMNLLPYSWNNRLHDKYLVVDGKYMIMGGRNISDKTYMPDGFNEDHVVFDRDIIIMRGGKESVIDSVMGYADELWASGYFKECPKNRKTADDREETIKLGLEAKQRHPELSGKPEVDYHKAFVKTDRITLVSNPIGRGSKEPVIWNTLMSLFRKAKDRILLQSPYIILYPRQLDELREVREQGVKIEYLTNSINTTPNLPAFPHYLRTKNRLLKSGDIWEYIGYGSIHSKSMVIDDDISIVGSFNLDPRSLHLDTESMLVIESRDFTEMLTHIENDWKHQSVHYAEDGSEDIPFESYKIPKIKRLIFRILGYICYPIFPLV